MASKKKTLEKVEEDNRHLNRQLFQLKDEMQHLNEELKTISCQKSATLIELQQLQKEMNNIAAQLEESKAKEQYALQQSEDAEKRLEKVSSQFKEKVQLMEQDCSRFQIEMSKLQLKVDKQESVILEKQEEIRVKDEAIQQLEQSQSRIKVDCSTRASNIETALVRSKKKCSALAREVESMSAEKMDLLNGYEQLKSDYEMANTPKALSVKEQIRNNSEHTCRRSAISDTCLVAATSTPVHGQVNMDWDISTVMSDYHRLQQDHQCLLTNFQQTTSKLQQLKQQVKEKDNELASLQKLYDESETRAKLLQEKLFAKENEQGIETVVANPETIREALEAKARIHGLEQSLEDLNKQYHIRNSELLEKQAVSDNLHKQLEARHDDISSLEKKLSASLEQIQSLTKALESRESDRDKESIHEVAEVRRQLDEMRRDKYALEDLLESAEGDFDQLKEEYTALKEEHQRLSDTCTELRRSSQREQSEGEKMATERISELQKTVTQVSEENKQLKVQLEQSDSMHSSVKKMERLLREKTDSYHRLEKDLTKKEDIITDLTQQLEKYRSVVAVDKRRVSTLEQRMDSYQKASSQAVDCFHQLLQETEDVEKQKFELISILEQKSDSERTLHRLIEELKEENESMKCHVREMDEVAKRNDKTAAELKGAIKSLEEENDTLLSRMSDISAALQDKEEQLILAQKQVDATNMQLKMIGKEASDLQNECHLLEADKERLREEADHLKEALTLAREDYDRTSHTLSSIRSDYIELQFAQKQQEDYHRELHKTIQSQQEEVSHLQQQLTMEQDELVSLRDEVTMKEAQLNEMKSESKTAKLRYEEEQLNSKQMYTELQQHTRMLEGQVGCLEHELSLANHQKDELQSTIATFNDKLLSQSAEKNKLVEDFEHYKCRSDKLKSELQRERALLEETKKAVLSFAARKKSHSSGRRGKVIQADAR